MFYSEYIIAIACAYLIGSIPASVWIGKIFYGVDVRNCGSGNAGATNTFRVLGKTAGIPVLLIDVLKGYLAVKLVFVFGTETSGSAGFVNFQMALGMAAALGHIFPVYVGFKGGKGIATLLGIMLAIHYQSALLSIGIFLLVLLLTKYVSLSSITAGFFFPLSTIILFNASLHSMVVFSLFIWIIILITHQKNIERLLKNEESKTYLIKKRTITLDE